MRQLNTHHGILQAQLDTERGNLKRVLLTLATWAKEHPGDATNDLLIQVVECLHYDLGGASHASML
jgi:hypothetical protein